jgi:hypothetical protein
MEVFGQLAELVPDLQAVLEPASSPVIGIETVAFIPANGLARVPA